MGPIKGESNEKLQQDDEFHPFLRICQIEKALNGHCGFHLSRTQWDPYPWVSGVENGSAAETAGLVVGDCVLEVNDEDVLGQRIGEVALKIKSNENFVNLLLWNAGAATSGITNPGPTPMSLQRLATCLQSVIQLLECPICMENITPPVQQCYNGHLLCSTCRAKSEKCPICRVNLSTKGRCLLADKLHTLLANTCPKFKPVNAKHKQSDVVVKQPFQLKSRLKSSLSESGSIQFMIEKSDGDTKDVNDMLPSSPINEIDRYHCPYGLSCDQMLYKNEIGSHIRHDHTGPVVQFFSKTGSVKLHLPILDLVAINTFGMTFYLYVTKYVKHGHNTLWLWLDDSAAKSAEFSFRFSINSFKMTGHVFSLTNSCDDILSCKSQECVKLSDEILDNNACCHIEILR